MIRLILKLCLLCALAGVYANGIDKIPDDSGGGGGGGGSPSTCTGADGFTCVCPIGQTCVTGRNLPCTCV
jgi:hypothetical protein